METKEAKDFLVEQAVAQAAMEGVALSEIEKRMMYFVENDPASCEHPLTLNDQFEAECDTSEYDAQISRLLHHAYDRLKAEDLNPVATSKEAIHLLSQGDHYLPVLWDAPFPSDHPTRDFFKQAGIGAHCGGDIRRFHHLGFNRSFTIGEVLRGS